MSYTPSGTPLPEGWVDGIWRASKAGAISWEDAQALQDMGLPICMTHGKPIKFTDDGGLCVQCVEDRIAKGKPE